jgi:hypothetical protein
MGRDAFAVIVIYMAVCYWLAAPLVYRAARAASRVS